MKDINQESNQSKIVLYTTADGDIKVDTVLQNESIWLTQSSMSELFDVKIPAVSKHLKNIFESGELDEKMVVSILENTTQHGAIKGKTQSKQVNIPSLHFLHGKTAISYPVYPVYPC